MTMPMQGGQGARTGAIGREGVDQQQQMQIQEMFMQIMESIAQSLAPSAPFKTIRPRSDRLPPFAAGAVATEDDILPQALMALQQILMQGQGGMGMGAPMMGTEGEDLEPGRF